MGLLANTLFKEGNDLKFNLTNIDANQNIITGDVIEIKAFDRGTNLWWGGTAFDQGSEPGSFTLVPEIGTTGEHELIFANAAGSGPYYRIKYNQTGTITRAFPCLENTLKADNNILLNSIDTKIDSIVAKLPAGIISDLSGSTTFGSVSFDKIMRLTKAMVNGRFKKNEPVAGQTTLYEEDNTTVLSILKTDSLERSRIL